MHNNQTTITAPLLQALLDLAPETGFNALLGIPSVFRRRKTQLEEHRTRLNNDEIHEPFVEEISDKGSKTKHYSSQCVLWGTII